MQDDVVALFALVEIHFICGSRKVASASQSTRWDIDQRLGRTSRCTRRRPHYGFSRFFVSPAAAAGELGR
jgi:hypothetical protein